MQNEARDFVAKRLSPAHIAVIVFIVTSLLLQAGSAFAEASASAQPQFEVARNFKDAVALVKRLEANKANSPDTKGTHLKAARENAIRIAARIAQKLQNKQKEIENDSTLTREQKTNLLSRLEQGRSELRSELQAARLQLPDSVMAAEHPGAKTPSLPKPSADLAAMNWQPDIPSNFKDAIAQARSLSETNPGSAALRNSQRKVLEIAEELASKLTVAQTRVSNDEALTPEQRKLVIHNIENMRTWMRNEVDSARIPIEGAFLLNPHLGASATNVHQIEVDWAVSKRENIRRKVVGGAKHFGVQYTTFGGASFLLGVMQMGWAYQKNPMSIKQNLQSFVDPVGATGFALFMAANHPVAKQLHGVMTGKISRRMIPYIALMAGSVASTVFHDVIADEGLQKCTKSLFTTATRDEAACTKASDNWVTSNKIVDWAPGLFSLVASQALADVARAALLGTVNASAYGLEKAAAHLTVRGMVLVPMAAAKTAHAFRSFTSAFMTAGFTPTALVIGGVQFVAFLYIDSQISEPIRRFSAERMLATLNLKTTAQKYGFHRDFYNPPENATQLIQNAFDVEATDLLSAHKYLRLNYINLAKTEWQQPEGVNKCVPPEVADRAIPGIARINYTSLMPSLLSYYFPDVAQSIPHPVDALLARLRLFYKKSNDQLRCEVLARPTELLERYGEQNKAWRDHLIGAFKEKQTNWFQLIGGFSEEMLAANKLTEYFADAKFKMTKDPSFKPDLSKEALQAVLDATGEDEQETAIPKPGTPFKISPLLDKTITALACGVNANKEPGLLGRMWNGVVSYWNSGPISPYIGTLPPGTSFGFYAPNITAGDGSVCTKGAYPAADTIYTPIPEEIPLPADTFTGQFRENGKTYTGLPEYIFENLNPLVWQSTGQYSGFATYWRNNISTSVEAVWDKYTDAYLKLVEAEFVPVAFSREFRNGCRNSSSDPAVEEHDEDGFTRQTTQNPGSKTIDRCLDNQMAYRVGKGLYLSIEVEVRNYIRGIHTMNASLYKSPDELRDSRAQIVRKANELTADIAGLTNNDLRDDDIEEHFDRIREKVSAINDLVEARLDWMHEPKEKSFRREILKQMADRARASLMEMAIYAGMVKMMDFKSASMRPVAPDVYKKKGGNPFNRGAQH